MEFEQIAYEVKGTTAIVTLNRPERRNALSSKLLRELNAALKEADEYNPVHCVILRGAGPHFSGKSRARGAAVHRRAEAHGSARRVNGCGVDQAVTGTKNWPMT